MSQLLDAVSYCHYKGIAHRNLKSKHVLLEIQYSEVDSVRVPKLTVKLTDFTMSKRLQFGGFEMLTTEVCVDSVRWRCSWKFCCV